MKAIHRIGIFPLILALVLTSIPVAWAIEIVRQKNAATYITFPIVNQTGAAVTGATGLDTEMDAYADGTAPDGFADTANEATEIGSTGIYYLLLNQTEMNNDYIHLQVKTSTSGAITQHILVRTMTGDPLLASTSTNGVAIDVESGGTVGCDFSNINGGLGAAEIDADAIGASEIANAAIDAATFAAGAIDAAAIAADAIGASEIATDAIGAAEIAANAIAASEVADNAIDAGAIAANAITTAELATGCISADEVADNAIDAGAIAAEAITSSECTPLQYLTGDAFTRLGAPAGASVSADIAAIKSDSGAILTDTAAMDTSTELRTLLVGSDTALSTLTAAGVWQTDISGYSTAGQAGTYLKGASAPSAATVADAVWDEAISGHLTSGTTGAALNAAGGSGDPWETSLPGAYGAGTAGYILGTNLNATVGSRSSHSAADVWSAGTRTLTAGTNIALAKGTGITGFNDIAATDVWSSATRTLTAIDEDSTTLDLNGTTVGGLTTWDKTGYTVSTVSDKTGYSLAASQTFNVTGNITGNVSGSVGSVTGAVGSVTGAVGSVTGNVGGNVTGSVGSVATGGITAASIATDAIGAAELASDAGTEIGTATWATAARTLTALDEDTTTMDLNATAIGSVTSGVTVTTNNDKTGYALSTAGIQAIWDALTSALTTVGSIGKRIADYVDAAISSRSTLTASDNIGINWADISNPTATVAMPNTTMNAEAVVGQDTVDSIVAGITNSTIGTKLDAIGNATDGDKEAGNYTGIETMIRSNR